MSQKQELKKRVQAKKKALEARLLELDADTRSNARNTSKRIRAKLEELEQTVGDAWDNITESMAGKLNKWLEDDPLTASSS